MTNNTLPNVPRELLERCCKRMYDMMQGDLHEELRAILSAPSPAGVDGLEVVAWQQRYIDPDEGVSVWGHADARSASILKGRSDYELRPLYAVPPDAQAIIDGLRGDLAVALKVPSVAAMRAYLDTECAKDNMRLGTERDQQAQRIGELEGLLLRTYEHAPIPLQCRIDAALSAGKEKQDEHS